MRRKLIKYDEFNVIEEGALSKAEEELIKAEDVVGNALGVGIQLHCFSESAVVYETCDNSYIHATYDINDRNLTLENIEELVIDEESARKQTRAVLSDMVDNILNKNNAKANSLFDEFMSMPTNRRAFMEGYETLDEGSVNEVEIKQLWARKKSDPKKGPLARKKQAPGVARERARKRSISVKRKTKGQKDLIKLKKDREEARHGGEWEVHARTSDFAKPKKNKMNKPDQKKLKDWSVVAENVCEYIHLKEFGPILENSEFKRDDRGNIVAIRIPTDKLRNEGKILQFNWKTLNHEVKVLRSKVKTEAQSQNFAYAMSDLRKANAMSDIEKTEEVIESVVSQWPNLLYFTPNELSKSIAEALDLAGEINWDDEVCSFLAEGIHRKATEAYEERVNRILRIAGVQLKDKPDDLYEVFSDVVSEFYPQLDETNKVEMQVFVDLYNTLVEVHKSAGLEGNELLKAEAVNFLRDLQSVIYEESEPTLELAGDVSTWLYDLIETNLETKAWDVSNSTYTTKVGEHPAMAEKAKKDYDPANDFSGDFGDPAPVSDGAWKLGKGKADAEEMRNRSWGNIGTDKEVWPSLDNPYVPGDPKRVWKMKEPSAVNDGESDWSRWQGGDTWPALQNPNVPKAETPKTYKMKSDNLVVDQ